MPGADPFDPARPDHLPVFIAPVHEFLKTWEPKGSPEVDAWIDWFDFRGVRYEVRRCRGLVMLYTHRVVTKVDGAGGRTGLRRPRWCCGTALVLGDYGLGEEDEP